MSARPPPRAPPQPGLEGGSALDLGPRLVLKQVEALALAEDLAPALSGDLLLIEDGYGSRGHARERRLGGIPKEVLGQLFGDGALIIGQVDGHAVDWGSRGWRGRASPCAPRPCLPACLPARPHKHARTLVVRQSDEFHRVLEEKPASGELRNLLCGAGGCCGEQRACRHRHRRPRRPACQRLQPCSLLLLLFVLVLLLLLSSGCRAAATAHTRDQPRWPGRRHAAAREAGHPGGLHRCWAMGCRGNGLARRRQEHHAHPDVLVAGSLHALSTTKLPHSLGGVPEARLGRAAG